MNLARSGFGRWTVIDNDRLMPHNLVRHELTGDAVGHFKAHCLIDYANSLTDGEASFDALTVDFLEPSVLAEKVAGKLAQATLILDISASVAVARNLAQRPDSHARRVSVFLNPNGEDLVLLAEDTQRTARLDSLEMQYYRALARSPELDGHYRSSSRSRYGQSCRDTTTVIPQDLVALHGGIASRSVKQMAWTPNSRITIWHSREDGSVRRIDVVPAPTLIHQIGNWTLCTDAWLTHKLTTLRENPNSRMETGGVLLGCFDLDQKVVYLIDTIPSPPDSEEWPTLYIRGSRGLERAVKEASQKTDGMLEYIGEWHSHPDGCSTAPSEDDLEGFSLLTELMGQDGLPAVIMIVGQGGNSSCFVGIMSRLECLLPKVPQ